MYSIMLDKVSKSYQTNNYVVKAVNQADFAADKGTSVAIIGPSGSGKSALLNMMGLIIYPDFGRILINGEDVTNLPDTALCHFRNSYFGYVVQDFALIERESVFNNIRIPLLYNKKIKRREHKERIHRAVHRLYICKSGWRKSHRSSCCTNHSTDNHTQSVQACSGLYQGSDRNPAEAYSTQTGR